jgi:dolichol-phosphate mannosyltransferase
MLSLVGTIVGVAGIVFGGVTVIRAFVVDVGVPGWASLMVITSLLGGLMLVTLGLIGEYLWRALDEVRGRPLYLEARVESTADRKAAREIE